MKARYWILIAALLLLGIGAYLYYRRSNALSIDATGIEGCIKVSGAFKPWQEFKQTDWGKYSKSLKKYLNIEEDGQKALVEAFFKAINVEPRSEYVRYFQKDIKKWLEAGPGLPHWDTEKGYLRCQ